MKLTKMERRLLTIFTQATDDQQQRGIDWYPEARQTVKRMAALCDITVEQSAAIVAVLSPQLRWDYNLKAAQEVATTKATHGVIGANVNKALRVLAQENPYDVLGGPKVMAFFANLLGNDNAVTVDTHMLRACGHHRPGCSPKQYVKMAQAITTAAQYTGLAPATFQAVVWIVVRESADYEE